MLIYATHYEDGCRGTCVKKTVQMLADRGIDLDKIVAAANGKGKIVPVSDGPDGPGIYFVGGGKSVLLQSPADPACGFICSVGLATTKVLGCQSQASCVVAAATVFTPGGTTCRAGRLALRGTRAASGSAARAAARANMRKLGLEGVDLANRSYNSGRKALEAAGFEFRGYTASGRRIFVNPRTGAKVFYDPVRKAHWHIQGKGGERYDRLGRVVEQSEGKAHIPAGP